MSIFIKAVKTLIFQALDKSMSAAAIADNSIFGSWRDAELSSKQTALTLSLRGKIQNFTEEASDKDSLEALKKVILEYDTLVENERKKAGYERKHLNETLTGINSNLDRFYKVISELQFKLTDITDDSDPFRILCAEAAFYFGENIFSPVDEGILSKSFAAVSGSTSVSVRAKKETCLVNELVQCATNLASLKDGFDTQRRYWVKLAIEEIQRENASICKSATLVKTIPVSLTFLGTAHVKAPTIKPSRGRLEDCMSRALLAINKQKTVGNGSSSSSLIEENSDNNNNNNNSLS